MVAVVVESGLSLSGMVICISTGIGRGWLSNNKVKATMPSATNTTAPIKRWRARVRRVSMLSMGTFFVGAWSSSRLLDRVLNRAIN